jgi:hypothetical protein
METIERTRPGCMLTVRLAIGSSRPIEWRAEPSGGDLIAGGYRSRLGSGELNQPIDELERRAV